MKWGKRLLILFAFVYLAFSHNPESWHRDISAKTYGDLEATFGTPTFKCPEVGACDIWVSGYKLFDTYFFASLMLVSVETDGLEKSFVYLPFYNASLHHYITSKLAHDG
jgi:hypothetical protein